MLTARKLGMHPLTLRFSSELERAFFEDEFPKVRSQFRLAAFLGAASTIIMWFLEQYIIAGAALAIARMWTLALLVVVVAGLFSSFSPWFKRWSGVVSAGVVAATGLDLAALAFIAGDPDVTPTFNLGIVLLFLYAFTLNRTGLRYGLAATLTVLSAWLLVVFQPGLVAPQIGPVYAMMTVLFFLTSMLTGYILEASTRAEFVQRRLLDSERAKSEQLLLNVLPAEIAERLKGQQDVTLADSFDESTVLFADLVDFTPIAASMAPTTLVSMLNVIFTAFDALAERHGLEKIKTIGDAYMLAGGLPKPRPDHAQAVAQMALDMQLAVAQINAQHGWQLHLRIGIDSGPVVAGVIGQKKFAYDLWGNTVNTASRMESHGVAGVIQVTEATYGLLRDQFSLQERGEIEVKGRGAMRTYFLLGRNHPE